MTEEAKKIVHPKVPLRDGKAAEGGGNAAPQRRQHPDDIACLFLGDNTMQRLLESLAEGLVVIDKNQRIVHVNRRMEEMFGYERREVAGQPLDILIPRRFAVRHDDHVSDFFAHPRIRPMGQGLELSARRKDGSEFPIDISLSFLMTETGPLSLALVTDVTRLKTVENDLRRRNEELDAFAHILAHELKGFLSNITGYGELLQNEAPSSWTDDKDLYVGKIMNSAFQASDLINELLLFAGTLREEVTVKPLSMEDIVKAALHRLSREIEKSGAKVIIPASYPSSAGHGPWIEEVWVNYLSNALKYGGRPPLLEIGAAAGDDGFARFWVRDNGSGLTPEKQSQLFTAHKRLEHHDIEGHGLGLSIVKGIVEKLGGQTEIESAIGKGSCFSFTLPAGK